MWFPPLQHKVHFRASLLLRPDVVSLHWVRSGTMLKNSTFKLINILLILIASTYNWKILYAAFNVHMALRTPCPLPRVWCNIDDTTRLTLGLLFLWSGLHLLRFALRRKRLLEVHAFVFDNQIILVDFHPKILKTFSWTKDSEGILVP